MAVIRDPLSLPGRRKTIYPPEFSAGFDKRIKRALGDAGGLTQFGVNLTTLEPGAMSALRHWHQHEDELVFVLEGEVTLITDAGEEVLGRVTQQYVYHRIVSELQQHNMSIVDEEVGADQSVKIRVRNL